MIGGGCCEQEKKRKINICGMLKLSPLLDVFPALLSLSPSLLTDGHAVVCSRCR